MKIKYTTAKSTLGEVLVAATERGVSAVYLGDATQKLVNELREDIRERDYRGTRRFLAMGGRGGGAN